MDKLAQNSKYHVWHDSIVRRAQIRVLPICYTEAHHILPRSMGGSDAPDNIVRLTYREHYLVHWLLTKIVEGTDLRKMQRALFAMTLKVAEHRQCGAWRIEAAKRAVRNLEFDANADARWYEQYHAKRAALIKKIGMPVKLNPRSRNRSRPGKRIRELRMQISAH